MKTTHNVVSSGLSHLRWTDGGARWHCNLTGTEAANDGATLNELPLPFSVSTIDVQRDAAAVQGRRISNLGVYRTKFRHTG